MFQFPDIAIKFCPLLQIHFYCVAPVYYRFKFVFIITFSLCEGLLCTLKVKWTYFPRMNRLNRLLCVRSFDWCAIKSQDHARFPAMHCESSAVRSPKSYQSAISLTFSTWPTGALLVICRHHNRVCPLGKGSWPKSALTNLSVITT